MEEFEDKIKEMEKMKSADREASVWSLLFADDNKAARSNHNIEDTSLLQEALDLIYKWSERNSMVINSIKTFGLRIGNAKYEPKYIVPNKK